MTTPRLLIANRGEIAVRIIRACRDLDISPVAVYSETDRSSLHVRLADAAVPIGPAPARESYLVPEKLIAAAKTSGATFVHPGYGFLAENAAFAQAVLDAGFVWVGPSPASISAMGSKTASRARMTAAGVPVVPGMTTPAKDAAEIVFFGELNGYPLLLKAAAGGGGKGMRVVRSVDEVPSAFARAQSEAKSYFADPAVYAELFVERPRHIEVQVLGDRYGKVIALGERECSLQRRHQKVLEECPSAAVTPELRGRMELVAVAAAKAVDYVSAGTVEFLLAPDGRFFFLEMNTRIQVEHPVTEIVYGVDLVVEMLRIARGDAMSIERRPEPRGHALQCRIYAEDPARNFAPSPGKIRRLRRPHGPGVRVDSGVEQGDVVPLDYDPMLAKFVFWGRDRDEAIRRARRALAESRVEGIETTIPFFIAMLEDPDFLANRVSTQFLDTWEYRPASETEEQRTAAFVAAALEAVAVAQAARPPAAGAAGSGLSSWRMARSTFGVRE
ncbi:MAG: acetyl/propionyl/methylcrotonyl-CoA carboxylase subunit alpha [Acidithiobacillales bacterium]